MPSDVASYEQDLTFTSNMTFDVKIIVHVSPTASVYAGCTETCEFSGLTWSDMNANGRTTLTVAGTATKTATRDGCSAPADDHPSAPATAMDCPDGMPSGAYDVTISGDTLTTTDASGGSVMYTRQQH
jgi:hypothetical protein